MACIALAGLDAHQLPVAELERLRAAAGDAISLAQRVRARLPAAEVAALLTCQRLEVIAAFDEPADPEELRAALRAACGPAGATAPTRLHVDVDALRQLARIACSLESSTIGEEQILGQVRDAIAAARVAGLAGPALASTFDAALRLGRRVRRETKLGELGTDLARLTLRHLRRELEAGAALPDGPPLVLVGTGEIARAVLAARGETPRAPWLIVSRDLARARELAAATGCRAASLDELHAGTGAAAGVLRGLVAASGRGAAPLAREFLERRLPLGASVVDLGMPRNVDPAARAHVRLADLDDLGHVAREHESVLAATVRTIEGWIEAALAPRAAPAELAR